MNRHERRRRASKERSEDARKAQATFEANVVTALKSAGLADNPTNRNAIAKALYAEDIAYSDLTLKRLIGIARGVVEAREAANASR